MKWIESNRAEFEILKIRSSRIESNILSVESDRIRIEIFLFVSVSGMGLRKKHVIELLICLAKIQIKLINCSMMFLWNYCWLVFDELNLTLFNRKGMTTFTYAYTHTHIFIYNEREDRELMVMSANNYKRTFAFFSITSLFLLD